MCLSHLGTLLRAPLDGHMEEVRHSGYRTPSANPGAAETLRNGRSTLQIQIACAVSFRCTVYLKVILRCLGWPSVADADCRGAAWELCRGVCCDVAGLGQLVLSIQPSPSPGANFTRRLLVRTLLQLQSTRPSSGTI